MNSSEELREAAPLQGLQLQLGQVLLLQVAQVLRVHPPSGRHSPRRCSSFTTAVLVRASQCLRFGGGLETGPLARYARYADGSGTRRFGRLPQLAARPHAPNRLCESTQLQLTRIPPRPPHHHPSLHGACCGMHRGSPKALARKPAHVLGEVKGPQHLRQRPRSLPTAARPVAATSGDREHARGLPLEVSDGGGLEALDGGSERESQREREIERGEEGEGERDGGLDEGIGPGEGVADQTGQTTHNLALIPCGKKAVPCRPLKSMIKLC